MTARRPRLDARLDEQVQRALDADQLARMREGGRGIPRGQPSDEPVREIGGCEKRHLPQQVKPAMRQDARLQPTSAGEHA